MVYFYAGRSAHVSRHDQSGYPKKRALATGVQNNVSTPSRGRPTVIGLAENRAHGARTVCVRVIVCIGLMFREWNAAQKFLNPVAAEKTRVFGQIIIVVMLALPTLSFLRAVLGAF
jgi:hypothetical protein